LRVGLSALLASIGIVLAPEVDEHLVPSIEWARRISQSVARVIPRESQIPDMRFVPREEKYFAMLTQLASEVSRGGGLFVSIFDDFENRARYAEQIKEIEVACDHLGARIRQKLNSSFITPIDREDIFLLVTELDDVIDMINDLARRFDIYDVTSPRREAAEVASILGKATAEIQGAFKRALSHNRSTGKKGRFNLSRGGPQALSGRKGTDRNHKVDGDIRGTGELCGSVQGCSRSSGIGGCKEQVIAGRVRDDSWTSS